METNSGLYSMLLKFLLPSSLLKGVLGKSFLPKGDSLRQSVGLMPVYPPGLSVCVCVCVCVGMRVGTKEVKVMVLIMILIKHEADFYS